MLALALYIGVFRRYRMTTVVTPALAAIYEGASQARLILDIDPAYAIQRSTLVWWEHEGQTCFARVAAIPGDRLESDEDQRWRAVTPQGEVLRFPPERRLPERLSSVTLAPGQYILFVDLATSEWPDSRSVGIVAREAIRYRVLLRM